LDDPVNRLTQEHIVKEYATNPLTRMSYGILLRESQDNGAGTSINQVHICREAMMPADENTLCRRRYFEILHIDFKPDRTSALKLISQGRGKGLGKLCRDRFTEIGLPLFRLGRFLCLEDGQSFG